MCKNHGYRHHMPAIVRAASLLCKDDEVMIETMLAAATYTGLDNIRRDMAGLVDDNVMAEVASLLEAVRQGLRDKAFEEQEKCLKAWGADVLGYLEDSPF